MKKILLILLVLVSFLNKSHARYFSFGAALSSTSSSLSNTTDTAQPNGMGAGGGLLFELRKIKSLSLESGILLVPRKIHYTSSSTNSDLEISMNSIQIPLMFKKGIGKFLVLGVGGYYNSGSGSITAKDKNSLTTTSYKYNEWMFADSDYGALVSLGFKMPIKSKSLLIEYRHGVGLSDVSAVNGVPWKISDALIYIGLEFGKSK